MKVYDRSTKEIYDEKQYKQELLNFLYNNPLGRIFLKFLINPWYSKFNGFLNNTKSSKKKIAPFVEKYNIDLSRFEKQDYQNFNEFFTRKPKLVKFDNNKFLSPCDGKLSVYKISKHLKISIKNSDYTLSELTQNENLEEFKGGQCLVFHLTMDSCHRYSFIDDGEVLNSKEIKGKLHTISSISKDYKIYKENHRVVSKLKTKHYDDMFFIEVGAIQVGKIVNHKINKFKRGDEKGYFMLGGSTIIILVKPDTVEIDEDIIKNCKKGCEVKVNYLESIGPNV